MKPRQSKLNNFSEAMAVVSLVAGLMREDVSDSLPATALKPLTYSELVLDEAAAKGL